MHFISKCPLKFNLPACDDTLSSQSRERCCHSFPKASTSSCDKGHFPLESIWGQHFFLKRQKEGCLRSFILTHDFCSIAERLKKKKKIISWEEPPRSGQMPIQLPTSHSGPPNTTRNTQNKRTCIPVPSSALGILRQPTSKKGDIAHTTVICNKGFCRNLSNPPLKASKLDESNCTLGNYTLIVHWVKKLIKPN